MAKRKKKPSKKKPRKKKRGEKQQTSKKGKKTRPAATVAGKESVAGITHSPEHRQLTERERRLGQFLEEGGEEYSRKEEHRLTIEPPRPWPLPRPPRPRDKTEN